MKDYDQRPAKGLWAPGPYICHCIQCKELFPGDKRAGHCADCAYDVPALKASPAPARPADAWIHINLPCGATAKVSPDVKMATLNALNEAMFQLWVNTRKGQSVKVVQDVEVFHAALHSPPPEDWVDIDESTLTHLQHRFNHWRDNLGYWYYMSGANRVRFAWMGKEEGKYKADPKIL